jgi:hypothetical protein
MRRFYILTAILLALSFSAQADEPKAAPEVKKVTVAVPKGTVKVVGVKIAKVEPKKAEPAKTEPVKAAESAPASQPAKADPAPAPAPAPAPVVAAQQNWWQEGLTELIKLICAILLILASAFVTVMTKKYGFESSQAVLDDILHRAVSYVEQTTTAKLGAGADKTPGAKKMEMAIEVAKKLAADTKLKEKGTEWWTTRLESWLGSSQVSKTEPTPPPPPA